MEHKYEVLRQERPGEPPTMDEQIARRCEEAGRPQRRERTALQGGKNSHTAESWAYVAWTWEGLR